MTEQAISPLRRRMIEDMTIRKFAQKTQHDYVRRVKEFASYLKRSPDTAKPEDVRGFQLHLASSGAGTPKINATVAALRFFFKVTLDRPDLAKRLSFIHEPRKAPVVLSPLDRLTPLRPKTDETKDATKQETNNDTKVEPPAQSAALLACLRLEVADNFRRHGRRGAPGQRRPCQPLLQVGRQGEVPFFDKKPVSEKANTA